MMNLLTTKGYCFQEKSMNQNYSLVFFYYYLFMIVLIMFVLFNIIRICEVLMSYGWWFIEFVVMIIIMFIWVLGG